MFSKGSAGPPAGWKGITLFALFECIQYISTTICIQGPRFLVTNPGLFQDPGQYLEEVVGDPAFMSPEMAREQYTESTDIYSYGLFILEMTTLVSDKRSRYCKLSLSGVLRPRDCFFVLLHTAHSCHELFFTSRTMFS